MPGRFKLLAIKDVENVGDFVFCGQSTQLVGVDVAQ
ncbi:Uncharacterised protein [Mycobacterium tuberculosis]|nr:Uncharacterised protein [Mycobacterium tuberculosis]